MSSCDLCAYTQVHITHTHHAHTLNIHTTYTTQIYTYITLPILRHINITYATDPTPTYHVYYTDLHTLPRPPHTYTHIHYTHTHTIYTVRYTEPHTHDTYMLHRPAHICQRRKREKMKCLVPDWIHTGENKGDAGRDLVRPCELGLCVTESFQVSVKLAEFDSSKVGCQ